MRIKFSILLGVIFFTIGFLTLKDYGINWDTINHLPRGQAYLNYFLTGNKDYSNLPDPQKYYQDPDLLSVSPSIPYPLGSYRSFYQLDDQGYAWYINNDGYGHPPLSDILSSFFNFVLFQKLGIVNDIDSYHVYGILLAAFLVGLIYHWTSKAYGKVAATVSSIALATYPLWWAESHFNTEKDVPLTVYWSFMLFAIWKGITKRSPKWVLISGILFGLALGTKFNILFIGFVIIGWLVWYAIVQIKAKKLAVGKKEIIIMVSAVVAILTGFTIYFISWPYLWQDPIKNIPSTFLFYKDIGTTASIDPRYMGPFGTNEYPVWWIVFTTPVVVLFLFVIGTISGIKKIFTEKKATTVLFLLWFAVPLARVVWPGTTIYGGIRQIMEYVPAMVIISGLGAQTLWDQVNKRKKLSAKVGILIAILIFIPHILKLIEIHPYENAYFNQLKNGLSGAMAENIPSWGNTFGGAYRQAAKWVDAHAEKDSKVVYAYELIPNTPRIWWRTDLEVHNIARSGYLMLGEYAVTLSYQGTQDRSYYDMYLNKFIAPSFEGKVDGVAVVRVWHNDEENMKLDVNEQLLRKVEVTNTEEGLLVELSQTQKLSRLEIDYDERDCKPLASGAVYFGLSSDGPWARMPGTLPDDWRISYLGEQPKDGKFIEPFTGQEAKYIRIKLEPQETCLKQVKELRIYIFE